MFAWPFEIVRFKGKNTFQLLRKKTRITYYTILLHAKNYFYFLLIL